MTVHTLQPTIDPKKEKVQLMIALDGTGSMQPVMDAVQHAITSVISKMEEQLKDTAKSEDMPSSVDLEVGMVVFKDYDAPNPIHSIVPLGGADAVKQAIQNVRASHGQDAAECLELALHIVATQITWEETAQKMLMVFTDAAPHLQGDPGDSYNQQLPVQYASTPDLWATVDALAAQKISTTIVACSNFNASPIAANVYSQIATRTNGRMVDFGLVQHTLPQFLSEAAQEELFVQNVNQRISSLTLTDEEQEQAIQEAMRGIGDRFRSLSSDWDVVVPFEDGLFDRHTSSKEFRDGFRALGATKAMPSHATSECECGDAMFTSLGAAEEEDGDAPTFRSCSAVEASPPRSKRMATTPPPMPGYARTPSTTADRIRRA